MDERVHVVGDAAIVAREKAGVFDTSTFVTLPWVLEVVCVQVKEIE